MFTVFFSEGTDPRVRATKCFTLLPDGQYQKDDFPHLYKINSYRRSIDSINELAHAVQTHAQFGHCLQKGPLLKDLHNEPRRDQTDTRAPTEWLLLDIDGLPGVTLPEDFIRHCLPPECHDVSYLWQFSSSWGITRIDALSGHLFMLLEQPIYPTRLKEWLKYINLTNPTVARHLRLSATGVTLGYPIDISVAGNDKLIYIAPPTCVNFTDPVPERFLSVEKYKQKLSIDFTPVQPALIDHLTQEKVNELRANQGLPRRTPKYKSINGRRLLANPERAQVTDLKQERDFVYIKANGAKSFGYYHPVNNPRVIYNWYGEPPSLTERLFPEYIALIAREAPQSQNAFVFRERKTDQYYNCLYDGQRVEAYPVGSKDKMTDFLAQYDLTLPDPVPDWTREFRPDCDCVVDFERRFLNLYEKTELIRQAERLGPVDTLPPIAYRILFSAIGGDKTAFKHFLNWLACIFQYKTQAKTAWVLQGTTGTGKGVLFHKILQPILGYRHCQMMTLEQLRDPFNEWLETAFLVCIDETQVSATKAPEQTMNQLKNLIHEPTGIIRRMRIAPYQAKRYCNFVFTSNTTDVILLPRNDRRFNIAPRQERKLDLSQEDYDAINDELLSFTRFMLHYPADPIRARAVLENQARLELMEVSENSIDLFFEALKAGDLDFFLQYIEDKPHITMVTEHAEFKATVQKWRQRTGAQSVVTRQEVQDAFTYIQNQHIGPNKLGRMMSHHGLKPQPITVDGHTVRGLYVTWQAPRHADNLPGKPLTPPTHSTAQPTKH